MTKEEILALIDAKIAGQGTNIDAGSALPEILSGILDLIPDGPTSQVQANLRETNPESPAYVNGIFRLVVQNSELLDAPEGSEDLFIGCGVPFVGTTTDERLIPFIPLTSTQKDELKSLIEQNLDTEISSVVSFFGQAEPDIVNGASGFAIVNLNGRLCYTYFVI